MTFIPCNTLCYPPPKPNHAPIPSHGSNFHLPANGPAQLAVNKSLLWKKGKGEFVTVFLTDRGNPSTDVTDAVKKYARLWEDHCSIRFNFVNNPTADIRVSFVPGWGHFSCVGTDRFNVGPTDTTMNLELNDDTPDLILRRVTLHEFGHALGCVHEHQGPAGKIEWKEQVIFDYYKNADPPWDEETVRRNIITPAQSGGVRIHHEKFDIESIMIYEIHPDWTANLKTMVRETTSLSRYDKEVIREMYPENVKDTRRFHTTGITNTASEHPLLNFQSIDFDQPYQFEKPNITVGLTSLHVDASTNVRIRTKVDPVTTDDFTIHLDSWYNTKLRAASSTWLDTRAFKDFQVGSFNTSECRNWDEPESKASLYVKFKTEFEEIPTIVVCLNWIDASNRYDTNIKAYASNPGIAGFTIHIDSSDESILYSGGASWMAYKSSLSGITSGVIETTGAQEHTNSISFPDGLFKHQPRALLAINSIHFGEGKDVDFDVRIDSLNRSKLVWRIESSATSMCHAIGASYIVLP